MSAEFLLILTPLAPLLVAGLHAWPRGRVLARGLMPWTPLPALAALAVLPVGAGVDTGWLLLGTPLGLDATGAIFLLFSALIWLATGWRARQDRNGEPATSRFQVSFLLAQAGNLGVCLAQDGLGFYAFFALMTFAAYGLVVDAGDAEARRAGRVYLAFAVAGEVLALIGLWLLADAHDGRLPDFASMTPAGSLAAAFLVLGFGVKTGLPLLHFALPPAYAVAPAAGAAVLAGALIKAGLLGWLRFLPLGEAALPGLGAGLCVAGALAIVVAPVIGLCQRRVGALLAYSSIAQMGHFALAIGVALTAPTLWPALWPALMLYAAHHALIKAALFLGLAPASVGRSGRIALALAALALAGAPLTGGFLAKAALKAGLADAALAGALSALFALGALGTALLMVRLFRLSPMAGDRREAGTGAFLALLAVALALPWWLAPASALATLSAPAAWVVALAPLALAAALAALARRQGWRAPDLPAGDLLVWLEAGARAVVERLTRPDSAAGAPPPSPARRPPRLEAHLRAWPVAGLLWLGLLAMVLVGAAGLVA